MIEIVLNPDNEVIGGEVLDHVEERLGFFFFIVSARRAIVSDSKINDTAHKRARNCVC